MSLWVLLLSFLIAADAAQAPVHLSNRGRNRKVGSGRDRAVPMASPRPAPAGTGLYSWGLPGRGDTLSVVYIVFGAGEGAGPREQLALTCRHDPAGITLEARTDSLETARPDSAWIGKDLNGDGEPDVVVRRSAQERPLTGQWIEVYGLSGGHIIRRLTRSAAVIPKSMVTMPAPASPVVFAVEPHAQDWPNQRYDPPARSLLLALGDSTTTDVSGRHPGWYEPQIVASGAVVSTLEARGDLNTEWATQLLGHTWDLLSVGRKSEARAYFEGHMARAQRMPPSLRRYLERLRPGLAVEWAGP